MIWADLRILVLDTGRVWWRTLPQILAVYLAGWIGSQLALKLAIRVGEWNSWAALAVFSFGFLAQLVAIVVMLQIVGRELGVRDLIPEAEAAGDDRDTSLTRLVSITLLPFLGIYAAFGEVSETASQLVYEQLFRNGVLSDAPSVLGTLNTAATQHPWWLFAGLVVIYLLRRGARPAARADRLPEPRHPGRPGRVLLPAARDHGRDPGLAAGQALADRAGVHGLARHREGRHPGRAVRALDPAPGDRHPGGRASSPTRSGRCSGRRWPSRSSGWPWRPWCTARRCSRWRSCGARGSPIWRRCRGRRRSPATPNVAVPRAVAPPPPGVGRAAVELKEAFLGDIDDKYLPTFHSLRLVLRAGVVFLGSYVAVYSAIEMASDGLNSLIDTLLGRPTDLVLVRLRTDTRAGPGRDLRTAPDLPAGGGVPSLPGAVLGSLALDRRRGVPRSAGPGRPDRSSRTERSPEPSGEVRA